MAYIMVDYPVLRIGICSCIVTLLNQHKINVSDDSSANLEYLCNSLPISRCSQSLFLLKVIALLDSSDIIFDHKTSILTAAALYVRYQIELSYNVTNPNRSNFYNSLAMALNLSKENRPDMSELVKHYQHLNHFLKESIFISGEPLSGLKKDHPFKDLKGLSVFSELKALSKLAFELEVRILNEVEKGLSPSSGRSPVLGTLFGNPRRPSNKVLSQVYEAGPPVPINIQENK